MRALAAHPQPRSPHPTWPSHPDTATCWCNSELPYGRLPPDPAGPIGGPPQRAGRPMGHLCQPMHVRGGGGAPCHDAARGTDQLRPPILAVDGARTRCLVARRLPKGRKFGIGGTCRVTFSTTKLAGAWRSLPAGSVCVCTTGLVAPTATSPLRCSAPTSATVRGGGSPRGGALRHGASSSTREPPASWCAGHGRCNAGFCHCHSGWFGHDCAYRMEGVEDAPGKWELCLLACLIASLPVHVWALAAQVKKRAASRGLLPSSTRLLPRTPSLGRHASARTSLCTSCPASSTRTCCRCAGVRLVAAR